MKLPANISALIDKYQSGAASPEEISRLNEWYHSFDDSEVQISGEEEDTAHHLAARMKSRLLETIETEPGSTLLQPKRKWKRPVAAAAIILLLVSVTVLLFPPSSPKNETAKATTPLPALNHDIAPGGNKALLTLADGSIIILDSASNGTLSTQGNIKVEKLDNGLLIYTINGKSITENDEAFYNTITTPRGGQYQVTLSDGTKVWLNAASSIRFPVLFAGKERRVTITGETYFEVAHNQAMPFKVKAVTSEVEVVGTHFNINAYDDEAAIKTTLVEGKVKVSATGSGLPTPDSRLLSPDQQSVISKSGKISVVNNADTEEAVAWKNGRFQFKSADIKSILRQIARWYDVEVEYKGNVDLHFTGQLTRNDNVSKVFEKLAMTGEVHFRIQGKKIIVSP
ncbi:MAG: FecR domain-containing protein [Chitinophagaceae bacterium]